MILTYLYKRYRNRFKQIEASLINEHWIDKCDYAATISGHNYYKFKSSGDLPLHRMERIQVVLMEMDARLSRSELTHLLGIVELNLQSCMNAINQKGKLDSLQKAIWAIEEVKTRQTDLMFHPDCMAQLAALSLIREDENPTELNEAIHKAKIDAFSVALSEHDFFLRSGLNTYLPDSEELRSRYKTNWELSVQYVKTAAKRLELIHSEAKLLNG